MEKKPADLAETQKLLKQVCSGKPGAFEQLFERYRAYLRQIVQMRLDPRLSQRLDASDVIQETQIEAARRAVTLEVPLPDHSSLELARQLLAGGSTPSQHISKKELAQRVREALKRLSEVDREILIMRNIEQLSYEDISYILGIDPASARKQHGRALLRLSKILRKNGLTESQV